MTRVAAIDCGTNSIRLLVADVRHDEVRTRVTRTAELELAELQRLFGELTARARARLAEDGFAPAAMRLQASLDMRYVGQAFELSVPFDTGLAAMKDVDHAFYVPAFLFKRDAIPGHPNIFDLSGIKPGSYRGECAEFCGLDHAYMTFTLRALPMPQFRAWVGSHTGSGA